MSTFQTQRQSPRVVIIGASELFYTLQQSGMSLVVLDHVDAMIKDLEAFNNAKGGDGELGATVRELLAKIHFAREKRTWDGEWMGSYVALLEKTKKLLKEEVAR